MAQTNAPWTYVEETGLLWYGGVGDTSIAQPESKTLAEVIYLKEVQWFQINIIYAPQVPTPYKCLRCGKYFASQEELTEHIQTVEVPAHPDAFLCIICGHAFTYQADLETHIREEHPELITPPVEPVTPTPTVPTTPTPTPTNGMPPPDDKKLNWTIIAGIVVLAVLYASYLGGKIK